MSKGLPLSRHRGVAGGTGVLPKFIKVRNLSLTVDGATGEGFGTAVMGDLPAGELLYLGASAYFTVRGPGSASLADDWEGDISIGTTATTDEVLTGTDQAIMSAAALTAAAEVTPRTHRVPSTGALAGVIFDNRNGALEMNVNMAVDDADISADGIIMSIDIDLWLMLIQLGN